MLLTPATLLLVQAAMLIAGPYALWRWGGVRHFAPLAVLQILAGVLLGPSVLGNVAPAAQVALFPAESVPRIAAIAQIAVVFYSFVAGLHLDRREFAGARGLGTVATGALLLPALAGAAVAPLLIMMGGAGVAGTDGPWLFAAAVALLTTVTALPVLAALLSELGLLETPFGQRTLGLAAINDSLMWLGVAALLLLAGAGEGASHAMAMLALVALLAVAAWLFARAPLDERSVQVLSCAAAALAAGLSEAAGFGYVIGAFAAGLIIPERQRAALIARLEWPMLFLFMPFFFMTTGLRIDTNLLDPALLGMVALLTAVATISKIGGTALAARVSGMGWRDGAAIGTALQTKGLMEVLVATILVDRGVIGEALFAPLILMALICTVITAPMLALLGVGRSSQTLH